MGKLYISELKMGQSVDILVMLKRKQLAKIPNASNFCLTIICLDRSGEIEAKLWEKAQEMSSLIQERDILAIKGIVTEYKGKYLLKIDDLTKVEESLCDLADFLPSTPKNRREMFEELVEIMSSVRNPYLRKVLQAFLTDSVWLKEFASAPADKRIHQPYIGGLLEHTLNVIKICLKFTDMYQFLDHDLLVTGAILHDIGKIHEFDYHRGIDYSTAGRLLGHIILGVQMVEGKIKDFPDFPEELRIALLHLIVSHHGQEESKSLQKPKFLEAILLHYADKLDSEMFQFEYVSTNQEENKKNLVLLENFEESFAFLKREKEAL